MYLLESINHHADDWNAERKAIFRDAQQLKQLASNYLQPELAVVTSDACACGRNFFDRPSAERYETADEVAEREQILQEAAMMKQFATDYLHPELPVHVDGVASARNFFTRPSAPEQTSTDEEEERAQVLQDAAALKKLATDYMQPELPVKSDGYVSGRNYFDRPSAEPYEDDSEAEECELVLQEMQQLKQFATHYLHPELPVESDAFACGRNFFSRPSADSYDDEDEDAEREDIMDDMKQLKQLAVDYLHPERPVQADPTQFGRNFFERASAPEQTSAEEEAERAMILQEAASMKKLATDYLHPELPVVSDGFACGRNYFSRPSAESYDSDEDQEERAMILEEAVAMKKLAVDYLHPELPVSVDATACGRNYFTRPSAPQQEDVDLAQERDLVMEDMKMLKQVAVDYLHPELPVATDATASGRNFFSRPSAEAYESAEEKEEQDRIQEDLKQLKKLATDYLRPELPVAVDSLATCRNYFDRPSAAHGAKDYIHSYPVVEGEEDFEPIEIHHTSYYSQQHHHHHDDDQHSHGSGQSDHFEMDEDCFQEFREQMMTTEPFKGEHPKEADEEEEEGKLSRSPSSVMLFEQGQEAV